MHRGFGKQTIDPRNSREARLNQKETNDGEVPDKPGEKATYWEIAINAMAKLNLKSLAEVDALTLTEYYCLIHASMERELYNEYLIHKQAFVMREVKATRNVGTDKNPKEEWIYKDFNKFFNYSDALDDLKNQETRKEKDIVRNQQSELAKRVAESNKKRMK